MGVVIWYSIPREQNLSINQIIEESGTVDLKLDPAAESILPDTDLSLKLLASTPTSAISSARVELAYSPSCGTPELTVGTLLTNIEIAPTVADGLINFTYNRDTTSTPDPAQEPLIAAIMISPTSPGICELDFTPNNVITLVDSETNDARTLSGSVVTIAQLEPSTPASADPTLSPSTTPQKPPKPTGLRSNCFDNGTKITLRWDAVSGATSYKVRLDQKDGAADKSTDNLTKTEHNYDLIPDQKYSWWVHATRNGVDSEEARIAEVVCAKSNTSSPTPSPSPKSTPNPTLKPTPKPTPKPTTKASTAPSATPPQLSPLPSTIANSSVTSGSLNDIFRDIEEVKDQPQTVSELNLFQKIAKGWQAIINALVNIF